MILLTVYIVFWVQSLGLASWICACLRVEGSEVQGIMRGSGLGP